MIDDFRNAQREFNQRMSKVINIIKEMAEFKENMHTRDNNMGFLEKLSMIVRAGSIHVKRVSVIIQNRPTKLVISNLGECFKRALGAKKIIKYKQSEMWHGTWIVWYVE